MPKLTIEMDEREWQLLEQAAQRQQVTPEQLVQQLLSANLRRQLPRERASKHIRHAVSNLSHLPRGSLLRVMTTLDFIHSAYPSDAPPPTREEIDAYLQTERDSWDKVEQ